MSVQLPICPKCGYDQSGEIATWECVCPLKGRCSECGTEFEWAKVYAILNEWGSCVDWYAEHADGLGELIKRAPGTMFRLMFPSRFFKDINHRRRICLGMLVRWVIVVFIVMHILVSPIGALANRAEGSWSRFGSYPQPSWWDGIENSFFNTINSILFPYTHIAKSGNGLDMYPLFIGYEWADYSYIAWIGVGAVLFWMALIGFVFLVRAEGERQWRREVLLLARVVILSVMPILVYLQVVRLGFGIHAATGMTNATNWVPWMMLGSVLVMIFWQQLIWTHAVRTIWQIKRSWAINIGGCFGSMIAGVFFAIGILT